jgi:hypothetical protein
VARKVVKGPVLAPDMLVSPATASNASPGARLSREVPGIVHLVALATSFPNRSLPSGAIDCMSGQGKPEKPRG